MVGMAGLDNWITGNYGEDQWTECFCPGCGGNVEEVGYTEVEGFLGNHLLTKCDECGALVLDEAWVEKWPE